MRPRLLDPRTVLWAFAVAWWTVCSPFLLAETFVVDRFDDANGPCDPGDCSLREALLLAEATPGLDRVLLPPGVHTLSLPRTGFTLSDGDLYVVDHDVEIVAPEGATVDAQGIDGVFYFFRSSSRMENLTITGGRRFGAFGTGGGIRSESSNLSLHKLWITDNRAHGGGGLAVLLGEVAMTQSTVSHNSVDNSGGAFWVFGISPSAPGRLEVENSTISNNHADGAGGAVLKAAAGELVFSFSTIVQNTNQEGGWTISSFGDFRYLLVEGTCLAGFDTSCIYLSDQMDVVDVEDLGLAELELNGGWVPTHELLPGSPALDIVPAEATCPDVDQRGMPRPEDGDQDGFAACDAGAFERGGPSVVEIPVLDSAGVAALALLLMTAGLRELQLRIPAPTLER